MFGIGQLFFLGLFLFILLAWVFSFEQKRGDRVFLSPLRESLDALVSRVFQFLEDKINYVGRHIIKLSWYYSLHKLLRFLLSILVRTYDILEVLFTHNKDKAKHLRMEKRQLNNNGGHLVQVADHKEATSLNESQKKKLLKKKLENG